MDSFEQKKVTTNLLGLATWPRGLTTGSSFFTLTTTFGRELIFGLLKTLSSRAISASATSWSVCIIPQTNKKRQKQSTREISKFRNHATLFTAKEVKFIFFNPINRTMSIPEKTTQIINDNFVVEFLSKYDNFLLDCDGIDLFFTEIS